MRYHKGASESSLLNVSKLHRPHGPPLPLGKQLRRLLQPKALHPIPDLRLHWFNPRLLPDRDAVLLLLLSKLLHVRSRNPGGPCRCKPFHGSPLCHLRGCDVL